MREQLISAWPFWLNAAMYLVGGIVTKDIPSICVAVTVLTLGLFFVLHIGRAWDRGYNVGLETGKKIRN